MTNLGMPVPNGFTITTEACTDYYENGEQIRPEIEKQIYEYLAKLERVREKAAINRTLLVSVRSSASLDAGNDGYDFEPRTERRGCRGLARLTNNERFAYDSYRRFIQMFSDVVMEIPKTSFEKIIEMVKAEKGVSYDNELDADDMKKLVVLFKEHFVRQRASCSLRTRKSSSLKRLRPFSAHGTTPGQFTTAG